VGEIQDANEGKKEHEEEEKHAEKEKHVEKKAKRKRLDVDNIL
jgi:hypothetical protein